jgi:membrane protease YdiL (CAAX protease family)
MKPFIQSIKKNNVITYFILTVIISWGAIQLLFGFQNLPVSEDQIPLIGIALLLGPFLSSIIMSIIFDGTSGLKNLFSKLAIWKVSIRWYMFVLLLAPLSSIIVLLILSIYSFDFLPIFTTDNFSSSLIFMGLMSGLMVAFFEELGWTGFSVPKLLEKESVLKTGAIVGIVWGIWHLPPFITDTTFTKGQSLVILLAQLFSWLPAFRILMVWMYKYTKSLLIVVLMHTSLVFSMIAIEPLLEGSNLLIYILAKAVLLWVVVFVVNKLEFNKH